MSLEDGTFAGTDPSSSARQDMPTEVQKDQIQTLLRDLRGMSAEPLAEGWKSTTLPLGHDQGQAVNVFVRDQPLDPDDHGSSHDAEPEQIQRAVFDVSLSELGRCQIDVLCQDKRFDFLMRSDRVLPSKNQQTISALFRSACDIAGVTGEINFKVGDFFEPTPPPTPPEQRCDDIASGLTILNHLAPCLAIRGTQGGGIVSRNEKGASDRTGRRRPRAPALERQR